MSLSDAFRYRPCRVTVVSQACSARGHSKEARTRSSCDREYSLLDECSRINGNLVQPWDRIARDVDPRQIALRQHHLRLVDAPFHHDLPGRIGDEALTPELDPLRPPGRRRPVIVAASRSRLEPDPVRNRQAIPSSVRR